MMGKLTAIDIGSQMIKIVVGKMEKVWEIDKVMVKKTFPGAFYDGNFIDEESILDTIFLGFIKKEINRKGLIFSMSGPFYSKIIEIENRIRKDTPDWLDWEFSIYFPDYYSFEYRYSIVEKQKNKMKFLVTAKPREIVERWRRVLSRLKIKNPSFIPEEISLFNLLRYNYPEIETPIFFLNIGKSISSLILVYKQKLIMSKKILLGIDEENFENKMADILDKVREIISFLPSHKKPTRLYLGGGAGFYPEISNFTQQYITIPSYIIDPFRKILLKKDVEIENPALFSIAIGSLLAKTRR